MSLEDLLKAETERLGFSVYGVAAIAPPPHLSTYREWVDKGHHASMAYLASERAQTFRSDPSRYQPEARSLLVVAMRHHNPLSLPEPAGGEPRGRVAAYAWGQDYHEVIPPRLEELAASLERALGQAVWARAYTDTGAVLERDFAQEAGLGWQGKNTCLIDPRSGSYYLLGELFLGVAIEPTPPFRSDQCGSCRRCIEACPTGAIREDRTIESARCISYLTIENKGAIPPELRPRLGQWVFGCDICQMVCPWNLRFAPAEGHRSLAPRPETARPALIEALRLNPQEFRARFRGSPILRARRRGYLRNIAVALGNARDRSAIPALAETLAQEPEALVRSHAAWALGQIAGLHAKAALEDARRREEDPQVSAEINAGLESAT
jgi:epoxyqueuosine reductase